MNKQTFLVIFGLLLFFSVSCKHEKKEAKFELNGYITEKFEGIAYLSRYEKGKLIVQDSAIIRKFKFKFKGQLPKGPEMYYLTFNNSNDIIEFFLENSEIQIDADFNKLAKAKITGSKSQKEYQDFLENNAVFDAKQKDLYQQFEVAKLNNDTTYLLQLDSTYKATFTEQNEFIKTFALSNSEMPAAVFITARSLANFVSDEMLEKLTENFTKTQPNSVYTKEVTQKLAARKRTAINQIAPKFTLKNSKGKNVNIADFKGKTVLLTFWMPENGKSRMQNKFYKSLYKKYKSKEFEFVSVAFTNDKNHWENIIKADSINWIQLSDFSGLNSPVFTLYGIKNINETYLIDKQGIILGKNFNEKSLSLALKNIFTK